MSKAFDIQRRRSAPGPQKTQTSRKGSGWGTGVGLALLAALIGISYQTLTQISPSQKITPTNSQGATPTAAIAQSPDTTPLLTALGPTIPQTPPPTRPTASPTPTPSIDKQSLKIRILNGSGTPGQATQLKQQLEAAGFPIRFIALAKSRRQTTTIYYHDDQEAAAQLIGAAITDHTVDYEANAALAQPDDILIIVGVN